MTGTAVRPSWAQLPATLRDGLNVRLGPIRHTQVQGGGFTPGLAARVLLADGRRAFVKGIRADHVLADQYRAEARVAAALPGSVPAPALWWSQEFAGWVVLVFDDAAGCHANPSPGSADVPRVVSMVAGLAAALTPCPAQVPAAEDELAAFVHGWAELAAAPPADLDGWARRHLTKLARTETEWLAAAKGDTLLHGDISASNMLVTPERVLLVDWAQTIRGAAWLDITDLIPHLVLAGHTPQAAEALVTDALNTAGADQEMVTSYAVAFAGYWARVSRLPAPPGVPHLRGYQARAADAALRWVRHCTKWE
ncbi:aminoglycoside phosphotransferase [Actinomadura sp. KC345]|uniref:RIO1 family regulatory kinase/ATPase domain-containing protein n=1 Tax=Actinomadura sp. KC345 TaxID=2530371 RepID=UPI00104AC9F1|nr:RIO1 family regulatory kinase/ATPase [Actinomadura sp. KC345]TDC48280.1 aminoglycoside phosphotransferase [Actinomadura sp. KC345]